MTRARRCGERLARALNLHRRVRLDVVPISIALPWRRRIARPRGVTELLEGASGSGSADSRPGGAPTPPASDQ